MSEEIVAAFIGVIFGALLTFFGKSFNDFKNRIKKHISLKKDIEQLKQFPPLNHVLCDNKMYNEILNLLEYYYFFKKTDLLELDVDVDLLILMKDIILYIEKSFIYFSHRKYPINYRIDCIDPYTGEVKL